MVTVRRSASLFVPLTVAALVVVAPAAVLAAPDQSPKVTICHRTNSLTNPYVAIQVAQSSVDGNGGNDKGQGDHFLVHTGEVWTSSSTKQVGWGDIIPPIPGVHDGLNWTPLGMAIHSAGCRIASVTDEDADGIPDVVDPDDDGDLLPDASDPDDDNDGIVDAEDPDQKRDVDTDGDSVPDNYDSDDDGDGASDDAECVVVKEEASPADSTTPETTTASATTGTDSTATTSTDNKAATGIGQDGTGQTAGLLVPRVRAADCGAVPSEGPRDDVVDTDDDGMTNDVDPDDDGDGISDASDRDEDGDTVPDVRDTDDDGDGVPDVLDPDEPNVAPPTVTDNDGDGISDLRDRDDDGDGIVDAKDADADGNGQIETQEQPLAATSELPATIEPGATTVLFRDRPVTVAGQPAAARVTCDPAARLKPAGDVTGRRLCTLTRDRGAWSVRVGQVPTVVTVEVNAPAVGTYKALHETRSYLVR